MLGLVKLIHVSKRGHRISTAILLTMKINLDPVFQEVEFIREMIENTNVLYV